jgi:hypothetical protein
MARRGIEDKEKNAPERVSTPTAMPVASDVNATSGAVLQVPAAPGASHQDAFVESWFGAGAGNTASVEGNFQIPDTFDSLQVSIREQPRPSPHNPHTVR